MAISLRACGSWAAANATTQTVTLPTHAAGDMLLVRVAFKHATMPTTVTCNTSGWNKVGQYNNGTTVSGNGTGSVIVAVFYKEATSAAETNPVITYHASVAATPSAAVALSYQKGATEAWVTPVGAGGSIGTSTSLSATITSHISTTAGDMVDFFHSQGDNNTLTVPTFTQAGLTLGTVSEQPAAALSSATSNDIDADGGYRLVSSGTSTAAAVVTGTASAGDQGSAWTTRLRVEAGPTTLTPDPAVFTLSAPSVSVARDQTLTPDPAVFTIQTSGGVGGDALVIQDTFTESTDTLLTSHTPDVGTGSWVEGSGFYNYTVRESTDTLDINPIAEADEVSTAVAGIGSIGDGYAQAHMSAVAHDSSASIFIRGQDVTSLPDLYYAATNGLYRMTAGATFQVASWSLDVTNLYYRIYASGSSPTYLKVEFRSAMNDLGTGWNKVETSDNTAANQIAAGAVGVLGGYDTEFTGSGYNYARAHEVDSFSAYTAGDPTTAVTLSHNLPLTPDPAVITLVAPEPTVAGEIGQTTLTPDPAVIALSAPDVTVLVDQALAPDPAVLTLVATDPTIELGALALSPDPAVLTVVATDPTITLGALTLTPDAAVLVLSAPTPAVGLGALTLSPDSSAFVLQAAGPSVALTLGLSPDPAALTLVATDPAISLALGLTPDPAALTLVAPSVGVDSGGGPQSLSPDPAVLTLSAPDISVALGPLTLSPDAAVIQITAPQPTVTMGGLTLTPDPAAIQLLAASISIAHALTLAPDSAALVLQAAAVSVAHALALTPDAAVLTIVAPTQQLIVEGAPVDLTPDPAVLTLVAPSVAVLVETIPVAVQEGKPKRRRRQEFDEYTLDDDDAEVIALILLTWT